MNPLILAILLILGLFFSGSKTAQAETKKKLRDNRPNVLLIMADDMGFSDLGCYGSEIKTPVLDGLSKGGLQFTQVYNGGRCCPTRASLLTGLYAHQTGYGEMEPDRGPKFPGYRGNLNDECVTIAEALKPFDYGTYMAGKWHLAPRDKTDYPMQRGFDQFYGTIVGAGNFYAPKTLQRDGKPIPVKSLPEDYYYTDAISDETVSYVRTHAKSDPDQPFFAYVAYTAPHWPLHAKEADIKPYLDVYKGGWDTIRQARYEKMKKLGIIDPKWMLAPRDERVLAWNEATAKAVGGKVEQALTKVNRTLHEEMVRKMAVHAAMITSMDRGIGRIIQALKDTGQYENTLIIFLADNGAADEWGTYGFGWNKLMKNGADCGTKQSSCSIGPAWSHVSNAPFRRHKLYMHEGGISTPMIMHWPKGIKARGELRREMGHIIDVMPTVMDVTGSEYPKEFEGTAIKPTEGVSLAKTFDDSPLAPRQVFWEHIGNRAMRDGKWKLVAKGDAGPWELYDMDADRTELNDLSAKYPDRVKSMNDAWEAWAKRADAVRPFNQVRPPRKPRKPKPKKKAPGKATK